MMTKSGDDVFANAYPNSAFALLAQLRIGGLRKLAAPERQITPSTPVVRR
jgi:hypothetical protein